MKNWAGLVRRHSGKLFLVLLIIAIAALVVVRVQEGKNTAGKGPGGGAPGMGRMMGGMEGGRPQPVAVGEARRANMPVWLAALGTVTPQNQVLVKARVDGELKKIYFKEGQRVERGQLLAEIDPRPYQAALLQAQGQLARDEAQLANARQDLVRYQDLWQKDSIARQQVDTQQALVKQLEGVALADRGMTDNAALQVGYARVTAPISGRAGLRQVDAGNIVRATDANGIVVIAQQRPINATFAVPESNLPRLTRRLQSRAPILVEAWDREQKIKLASGHLLTIDNLVDTATGTIKARAEFANADETLFPSQFVNIRLLLDELPDALVIPSAAVLRGASGSFVFALDAENAVHAVTVTPLASDAGLTAVGVETDKLSPGAKVVLDGADKLREGAKVEVILPGERSRAAGAGKPQDKNGSKSEGDKGDKGEGKGSGWRRPPNAGAQNR